MNSSKRIIVNTIAQYAKALINIGLSLYTVRLILGCLGQSDYGIYSVVASVVSMLGFVTNAMVTTTQRYLSVSANNENVEDARRIFSNSMVLHILIGVILMVILLPLAEPLCKGFLNIDNSRRDTAVVVYVMSCIMLLLTMLAAPFKALLIAHENIIYLSAVEVFDGILKVAMAIWLIGADGDKLILYSFMMTVVFGVQFLFFSLYAGNKYRECSPRYFLSDFSRQSVSSLFAFAGWTTYGNFAVVLRTQGIAILVNKFFGTILNAAYGIAFQVFGAVSFVATSLANAVNPQLMQAEGSNDRGRSIHLAEQESKFIITIMAILFIPLMVEMDSVLTLWLKEVPPYTSFFTNCVLLSFIIDQSTYGLNAVNQALGKIRTYTLIMYTPKLLTIFIVWGILFTGGSVRWVMYIYLFIEALVAFLRLPYMHKMIGLNISQFVRNVIVCTLPTFLLNLGVSLLMCWLLESKWSFAINIIVSMICGLLFSWFFTLTPSERNGLKTVILKWR